MAVKNISSCKKTSAAASSTPLQPPTHTCTLSCCSSPLLPITVGFFFFFFFFLHEWRFSCLFFSCWALPFNTPWGPAGVCSWNVRKNTHCEDEDEERFSGPKGFWSQYRLQTRFSLKGLFTADILTRRGRNSISYINDGSDLVSVCSSEPAHTIPGAPLSGLQPALMLWHTRALLLVWNVKMSAVGEKKKKKKKSPLFCVGACSIAWVDKSRLAISSEDMPHHNDQNECDVWDWDRSESQQGQLWAVSMDTQSDRCYANFYFSPRLISLGIKMISMFKTLHTLTDRMTQNSDCDTQQKHDKLLENEALAVKQWRL